MPGLLVGKLSKIILRRTHEKFKPTKKGCNLRIEMWDTKRNTKENVDIIFK